MQKFRLIFKRLCQSENKWHDLNYIYCMEVDSQSLTTQETSRVSINQLSALKNTTLFHESDRTAWNPLLPWIAGL